MGEVSGSPAAIRERAADLRRPLVDVHDAITQVEARARAYVGAPASIHTTSVSVPIQLDEAIPWVRDLAASMDQFAQELEDADQRFGSLSGRWLDPVAALSGAADWVEAGSHVVLTRWKRDIWRHSVATFRHWRLQRHLTTASDYLATGLPRPARRALMRDHNRGIRNDLARVVRAQHASRASVVAGRGDGWVKIHRTVGSLTTRFPRTASVARLGGRFLGAAGVALSVRDVVVGVRDGDTDRVVEGVAGLGAAAAFVVGGPVGVAVGVAFVAGSIAWRNRDELARGARILTDSLGRVASRAASSVGEAMGAAGEAMGAMIGDVVTGGMSAPFATVGGWFD